MTIAIRRRCSSALIYNSTHPTTVGGESAGMGRCKPLPQILPRSLGRRLHTPMQCVFALVTTPSAVEFLASPLLRQEKQRFLSGDEMLSSLILPINEQQSNLCGAPALNLSNLKNSTKAFMAGNSMSVPCVGLMLLAAALALEPISID